MKPILFFSSPVPNYLTFILCSLGINWKNEFTEQYANFLSKADQSYLLEHQSELSFGDGEGDALMELFYFLPAHIGFEKDHRIIEYFQVLGYSAKQGDFKQLFMRFHTDMEEIRKFYPSFMHSYREALQPEKYEVIYAIAGIYQRYYDDFLNKVWSEHSENLEYERAMIDKLFKGKDMIRDWEVLTEMQFQADSYKLCLIPFIKNGPGANSLSYDKNLFISGVDENTLNYYNYFISHEIGTHLLWHCTLDRFASDVQEDMTTAYIAVENIARYYNLKIIPITLKYSLGEAYYHESVFEKLFAELELEYPGDIAKQYSEAIRRFHELHYLQTNTIT